MDATSHISSVAVQRRPSGRRECRCRSSNPHRLRTSPPHRSSQRLADSEASAHRSDSPTGRERSRQQLTKPEGSAYRSGSLNPDGSAYGSGSPIQTGALTTAARQPGHGVQRTVLPSEREHSMQWLADRKEANWTANAGLGDYRRSSQRLAIMEDITHRDRGSSLNRKGAHRSGSSKTKGALIVPTRRLARERSWKRLANRTGAFAEAARRPNGALIEAIRQSRKGFSRAAGHHCSTRRRKISGSPPHNCIGSVLRSRGALTDNLPPRRGTDAMRFLAIAQRSHSRGVLELIRARPRCTALQKVAVLISETVSPIEMGSCVHLLSLFSTSC
jgi:hypothetical protein